VRPPRLRCELFPLIYPSHLLVISATIGLHLLLQTYPYFRALYVIPVRRTKGLPTASFRFHLTMDILAVQLCASSLPRYTRDFHPLEPAHGGQTKRTIEFHLSFLVTWRRSTLPGPCGPSTIDTGELNFCVRDGNRCGLSVIATRFPNHHKLRISSSDCVFMCSRMSIYAPRIQTCLPRTTRL
jgi:hypothetical protein